MIIDVNRYRMLLDVLIAGYEQDENKYPNFNKTDSSCCRRSILILCTVYICLTYRNTTTCIKRSSLEQRKGGLRRQVTS